LKNVVIQISKYIIENPKETKLEEEKKSQDIDDGLLWSDEEEGKSN